MPGRLRAGRPKPRFQPRFQPRPQPRSQGPTLQEQASQFVSPNTSPENVQPSATFGAYNSGSTAEQTVRNEWLNTLSETDKMKAMNKMGYFTGGVAAKAPRINMPQSYLDQLDLDPGEIYTPQINGVFAGQVTADASGNEIWDPLRGSGGGGAFRQNRPNQPRGQNGLGRPTNFSGPSHDASGAHLDPNSKPHTQFGQQGAGTGRPNRGGGGAIKPIGATQTPGNAVGGFPNLPPAPPNFLPMTPGYEHAFGQASDQLGAAEGQYAEGQAMIPAQLQLQQARLGTDKGVATDRLKEQLAERGVYTPYGPEGPAGGPGISVSPAGGGVGQSLYSRQVGTPYGRAEQDLGAAGAGAYQDLARGYGGAQLGFNQQLFDALLGRASDAYQAMPLGASYGDYGVPSMPGPAFSYAPRRGGGSQRPRRPGRGRNTRKGNNGRPNQGGK